MSELLLLQQLKVLERRAGVHDVLEVRRTGPVLQVGEVRDEFGAGKQLLGGEVVEVVRVREGLDELSVRRSVLFAMIAGTGIEETAYLELDLEPRVAAIDGLVVCGRRRRLRGCLLGCGGHVCGCDGDCGG